MRLVTVRIIALVGLALDIVFHWMEERNIWEFLVDDFFEAENEARWAEFALGGSLFIRSLSITAHVLLLSALLALIFAPWLIREIKVAWPRWMPLKFRRLLKLRPPLLFWRWLGGVGLVVDFVFHWLEQGSPADVLLDDFFEGSLFFRLLSLAAHLAFITATLLLILAPRAIKELRPDGETP